MPECRIRVLDEEVANKIAAGEVVERPASVVKELVENCVDAGATRIHVEVLEGGKRLIRVTDNGCGMTAQEAVLSLQRHATSKISQAEDLAVVRTLGFRGEALPSIASVCRLSLVTCPRGETEGVRVAAEGGVIQTLEPAAAGEGCVVTVEDLFYNTPVRLKFLRTPRTELTQICDVLTRLALSHPEISVRLTADHATALQVPGVSDPINTITGLFGAEVARELLPVSHTAPGYAVEGLVSRPSYHRATRAGQHLFVNGRAVRSRSVTHALDEAYRATMPSSRYPFVVLHLELDPALVDVNVHPAKSEVRFLRDWEVHQVVLEAVRQAIGRPEPGSQALAERSELPTSSLHRDPWLPPAAPPTTAAATPTQPARSAADPSDPFADDGPGPFPPPNPSTPAPSGVPQTHLGVPERTPSWPEAAAAAPAPRFPPRAGPPEAGVAPAHPAAAEGGAAASRTPAPTPQLSLLELPAAVRFRRLGQLWDSYLLAEGEAGLWIVDQHLAHERLVFDALLAEGRRRRRPLTPPAPLQLSPGEARAVPGWLSALGEAGFELEGFGQNAFLLRSAPAEVGEGSELVTLRQVLDDLLAAERAGGAPVVSLDRVAASTACRTAVKKGTPLGTEEQERLLHDLERSSNPYTCPHGCAIAVQVSYEELLRRFKRV